MDLESRVDVAYDASVEAAKAEETNAEVEATEDAADGAEASEAGDDSDTSADGDDTEGEGDSGDAAAGDADEDDGVDEDIEEAVEEAKVKTEELPPINKFIYDNLSEIVTSGTLNGKDVTIKVKTANEIPDGFEWKSKRDEKIFDQALIDQGVQANNLSNDYKSKQSSAEATKFQQAEANDIQSDLKDLQSEGLIPKFSTATANSNPDDPGVKIANEVLTLYNKENATRLEKWQKAQAEGRNTLYNRISYRDAFEKYQAKQASVGVDAKKAAATKERKEATAKVGKGRGGEEVKARSTRGMTVDEILEMHDGDFE